MDNVDKIKLVEGTSIPSEAKLPTSFGDFNIRVFHEESTGLDHVALTLGKMEGPDPVLIRVHSECLTGDAFTSLRCDCGPQLQAALRAIQEKDGVAYYIYVKRVEELDYMQKFRLTGYKTKAQTL